MELEVQLMIAVGLIQANLIPKFQGDFVTGVSISRDWEPGSSDPEGHRNRCANGAMLIAES